MGKLVLRALHEQDLLARVVLINDRVGSVEEHAHLLEFDTVHGRWHATIKTTEHSISIDGVEIAVTKQNQIASLPLSDVDLLIDCTGAYRKPEMLADYFTAGAKKTLVSCPVNHPDALNIVYGINHHLYDPNKHDIVTAASCTTNCIAPVIKVVHEQIGIRHGTITTLHDVTNTQTIVDRPGRDLRRARSALNSLIPTTTGSARAIELIYPDLAGQLNGIAVRVPLLNASLSDCVFETKRATSVEEVNNLFQVASTGTLQGILGYETRPLVSADFVNDARSAIVDGPSTQVVDKTLLKVLAWYDNEWGYACRVVDLAQYMIAQH